MLHKTKQYLDMEDEFFEKRTIDIIDSEPNKFTGLYNHKGQPLYHKKIPFGFRRNA